MLVGPMTPCVAWFLLAFPVAAATSAVEDGPAAPSSEADENRPDRRRVLRLADGRVVRGRSRFLGQGWEVREGRDWRALEGQVVSARLEREATAEARARLRDAGEDLERTVQVAAWMLDEGLSVEGLEAISLVLERERGNPAALELVSTRRIELELEDAGPNLDVRRLRALLGVGAGGSLAEKEVAARLIGEFEHVTDLAQLVKTELTHQNLHHRAFAVLMAQRLLPGRLLEELVDRALLDRYESVRVPAAEALAAADEVASLAPMIRALSSEHAALRLHAVEAMGRMGYLAAVEPLAVHLNFLQSSGGPPVGVRAHVYIGRQTAIVGDYDVEIAQGASIADPVVGVVESGVVLDVRAVAHITRVVEQRAVIGALAELTGGRAVGAAAPAPADPSIEAWLAWWEDEAVRWRAVGFARDDG